MLSKILRVWSWLFKIYFFRKNFFKFYCAKFRITFCYFLAQKWTKTLLAYSLRDRRMFPTDNWMIPPSSTNLSFVYDLICYGKWKVYPSNYNILIVDCCTGLIMDNILELAKLSWMDPTGSLLFQTVSACLEIWPLIWILMMFTGSTQNWIWFKKYPLTEATDRYVKSLFHLICDKPTFPAFNVAPNLKCC